jgi:antirestriction protein
MNTAVNTTPRVYVGTYHKYNSGSISGAWIDLDGLTYDEFMDKCRELHSDEQDPEFMFQDYEGFPERLYSESDVSEVFQYLEDTAELSEDEAEAFEIYVNDGNSPNVDEFRDAYVGCFTSYKVAEELAEWELDQDCEFQAIPERFKYHFDYEAYGEELLINEFWEHGGYVFRRM